MAEKKKKKKNSSKPGTSAKDVYTASEAFMGGMDDCAVRWWLPTNILTLDLAINRGLPGGRITEIIGDSQSGKTLLALCICKSVQNLGGLAVWLDAENRLSQSLAEKYNGIDLNERWIYYNRLKTGPLTVEGVTDYITLLAEKHAESESPERPLVVVVDSIAALYSLDQDPTLSAKRQMGLVANRLSAWLSYGIPSKMARSNFHLIFINQTRQVLDFKGYGGPQYTTPAGKAIRFYASTRLEVVGSDITPKDIDSGAPVGPPVGNQLTITVIKNSVAPPKRYAIIPFWYYNVRGRRGLDDKMSQIDYLVANKVLKNAGGWYQVAKTNFRKFDLRNKLYEHPKLAAAFEDSVRRTFASKHE